MRMKGSRGHNKTKKNRRQLYAMAEMHPVQTRGMRKQITGSSPTEPDREARAGPGPVQEGRSPMPRARNRPAARRRHKNVLAQTKGHHGNTQPHLPAGVGVAAACAVVQLP